jgi:hypothetical protein
MYHAAHATMQVDQQHVQYLCSGRNLILSAGWHIWVEQEQEVGQKCWCSKSIKSVHRIMDDLELITHHITLLVSQCDILNFVITVRQVATFTVHVCASKLLSDKIFSGLNPIIFPVHFLKV